MKKLDLESIPVGIDDRCPECEIGKINPVVVATGRNSTAIVAYICDHCETGWLFDAEGAVIQTVTRKEIQLIVTERTEVLNRTAKPGAEQPTGTLIYFEELKPGARS